MFQGQVNKSEEESPLRTNNDIPSLPNAAALNHVQPTLHAPPRPSIKELSPVQTLSD